MPPFSLPWCTLYVNVKLSKACAELKITYQLYGLSIRNPIRKVRIAEPLYWSNVEAEALGTGLVHAFMKIVLNPKIPAWHVLKFGAFSSLSVLGQSVLRDPILLYSFSSDKARRTDSRIRRKTTVHRRRESNPGSCIFQPHAPTTELRSHNRNCAWNFDFHQAVSSFSTTRWPRLPESTT